MADNVQYRFIIWILCLMLSITWTYADQDDENLQKFCVSRKGLVIGKACFYISDENKDMTWDEARLRCKDPDQNVNSDLFYTSNDTVFEEVLKHWSGSNYKFWTAAAAEIKVKGQVFFLWRGCTVPQWLADNYLNKIAKGSQSRKYLMIERKSSTRMDFHLADNGVKAKALCRYSPAEDDSCPSGTGTTMASTTETETSTTKYELSTTENGTSTTENELSTTENETSTTENDTSTTENDTSTLTPTPTPTPTETTTQLETTTVQGVPCEGPCPCKKDTKNGVTWDKLEPGENGTAPCPTGYKGNATWNCSCDGGRIPADQPDYTNCEVNWISESIAGKNSTEGSSQLATDSDHNFLLKPNDLDFLEKSTKDLVEKFHKEFKNANAGQKSQMVDTFANSMVHVWSNSFDEFKNPAWSQSNQTFKVKTVQSAMKQLENVGHTLACFTKDESAVNGKTISVKPFNLENEKEIVFGSSEGQINLPNVEGLRGDPCQDVSERKRVGVGIEYNNMATKLMPTKKGWIGISNTVIGFSLNPHQERTKLPKDNHLFVTLSAKTLNQNDTVAKCSYWDFRNQVWSQTGCWINRINGSQVVCECDHLTNFAVLVLHKDELIDLLKSDDKILTIISYVGCTCSVICLIFTIVCLTGFQALRCRRNTITTNLCVMLLSMNLLVLFGLNGENRVEPNALCWAIAIALHYTLLSSFSWMLMEGYLLYQMIVVVFSEVLNIKMRWFYLLGYGFPLCVVAISSGAKHQNYVHDNHCWISVEDGIVFSFLGPVIGIIFINAVIFVCAMKAASDVRKKKMHNNQTIAVGWLKGSFSMMCLLGVTWVIGAGYFNNITKFFIYIFVILNSLQGVLIFVFHVVMNEKTRSTIIKIYKTRTGSNTSATSAKTVMTLAGGSFLSSSNQRASGSSLSSNLSSRTPMT